MEYLVHWCSILLKNKMVHGINKPGIENTSTGDLIQVQSLEGCFVSAIKISPAAQRGIK